MEAISCNNNEFFSKVDLSSEVLKIRYKNIFKELVTYAFSISMLKIKNDKTIDKEVEIRKLASTKGLNDITVKGSTFSFRYEKSTITIKPNSSSVGFNVKLD